MTDRWLCGWRVAGDLPLPELQPWNGDAREPDVTIRVGAVPAILDDPIFEGPVLQVAADGTCRYEIAAVAAFLIRGGRDVVVQPRDVAPPSDVRTFVLGAVLAILCHQRGLIPLHASCIEIAGQAVAFAGPVGAGKSTLAAAARRAGHRILSDDVTVLAGDGSRVDVLPSYPRLRLWQDAWSALCAGDEQPESGRTGIARYGLALGPRFRGEPLALAGVVHLTYVSDARFGELRELHGAEATARLHDQIHTSAYPLRSGHRRSVFARLFGLIPGIARHFVLAQYPSLSTLDASLEAVRARLSAGS